LTDGHKEGALNAGGSARCEGIAAGTCTFHFKDFYQPVEQFFDQALW